MTTIPQATNTSVPAVPKPFASGPVPTDLRPRFNVRLWIFIAVISAPFLYIIGSAVYDSITGGITDRGSYKEVDLKALGNFNFDDLAGKREDIPERYRNLDGQRVMFQGKMFGPEDAGPKGRRFQLVYDVNKCCFSGKPLVQERVFATAKKEIPIYDQNTLAEVVGTLHVRLIRDPVSKQIVSVYDMDVESAKAVEW
jgi:hypothetical protein